MANFLIPTVIGVGSNLLLSLFAPSAPIQQEGKLEDTGIPTAEYGFTLSYPFGKLRKDGLNMMWALKLKEVKTKKRRGGKGGGGQVTEEFSYFMTAAYPIAQEISSVRRVWMNEVLVYSATDLNKKSQKFLEHCTIYTGNQTTPSSVIQSKESDPVPAFTGWSYLVFNNYPIAEFDGSGFPRIDVEVIGKSGENPRVKDILATVCRLAKINNNQIDVSDIPNDWQIEGFDLQFDGTSFGDQIQELMRVFFIVARETKDKIIFKRQESPNLTFIPRSSLGAKKFGENPIDIDEKKLTHFREIPSAVTVTGINVLKDYNDISVTAKDPSATHTNELTIQTRLISTDNLFITLASKVLFLSKIQSKSYSKMFLLPAWDNLKIGDLIFTDSDQNFHREVLQITKKVRGAGYLIEIEAVRFQGYSSGGNLTSSFLPTVIVNNPFPPTEAPREYGEASAIVFECPVISGSDTDIGIYAAIDGDQNFRTGSLFYSENNGLSYEFATTVAKSAVGTVLSFSSNFNNSSPNYVDKTNTIRVRMDSEEIEPVTLEAFLSGRQLGWFSTGEIVAFKNATIVSSNPLTFDLSYMIRGIKGTEPSISRHIIGERFVLLTDYLARLPIELNNINQQVLFKVVPNGLIETEVEEETSYTIQLEGLKPFPPSVRGEKTGNDVIISWYRRTRLNGRWTDYVDVPYANGELDSYTVRIYDGTTVKREWVVTAARSVVYAEAQQIADWGSVQSAYTVRVFQNSSYPVPFKESLATIV